MGGGHVRRAALGRFAVCFCSLFSRSMVRPRFLLSLSSWQLSAPGVWGVQGAAACPPPPHPVDPQSAQCQNAECSQRQRVIPASKAVTRD